MNILIAQPKLEKEIKQLENEVHSNPSADILIFPEGYLNQNVDLACKLAEKYEKIIVSGYKWPKDRAIVINRNGKIILDRAKYNKSTIVEADGISIGHMLCDELVLQGMSDLEQSTISFIAHPIGVGMFSEDQFDEWINEAKKIAIAYKTLVIGTSHADGSFRDSDISIPISYCIDENGEEIFISKNDVRTRIMNTQTRLVTIIENEDSEFGGIHG
ncbi:hypothetical protein [Cohnella luojiensis]|uniref:CN hydrolase domain-containing protein n=1 Tax=Cohnella luojiensis TaxID=652876 RepID=A0A4Y8LR14_9BACL|nr:hypothetical protein [Cohnella luojiensis]TFE19663.1 hypothetical protein E2980_22540 [Cohnella luojiensis]